MKLHIGKPDSDVLQHAVLDAITYHRPEVLVRAGIGEDCAVVDFTPYECVISTDPITAAISEIGRLAVHISCNDIASNGVEPLGIVLTVLLPEGTTEEELSHLMAQAAETAAACRVEIMGGHTEVTAAVRQPVIVSTAIGRCRKWHSASARSMEAGDAILMTKSAGLEGTGILATDRPAGGDDGLSAEERQAAASLLSQISVIPEGVAAGRVGTHGMHDVTEGGILGAIWEMCHIAGLGCEVDRRRIPIHPVTQKLCDLYGIDPLRLISSGTMLIMVSPEKQEPVERALSEANVPVTCIGRILPREAGLTLLDGDARTPIEPPRADELYKALAAREV